MGASTLIKISAASHVILRRDMPCQTELQARPPVSYIQHERILLQSELANAIQYADFERKMSNLMIKPIPMRCHQL